MPPPSRQGLIGLKTVRNNNFDGSEDRDEGGSFVGQRTACDSLLLTAKHSAIPSHRGWMGPSSFGGIAFGDSDRVEITTHVRASGDVPGWDRVNPRR